MEKKEDNGRKKARKIRQSGHFVDQKLKRNDEATSIFDCLRKETKDKILQTNPIEIRAEGIKLTPVQDRLINGLLRLLSEKSENRNEKSEKFYAGNHPFRIVPYGGNGQEGRSSVIRLYPSELYTAYLDRNDYSGDEIKAIKSVLQETEQQKFLIIYERQYQISKNGRKEKCTDRIEDFQSLFKIISFFEGLTEDEKRALNTGCEKIRESRGELIIALNPLLTDQINSKYVEYPADINRRTMIAAGGYKFVTESTIALRDYILREISAKRRNSEINEDNLIRLLKLEKYLKAKRRKLIENRIQSAIQTVRNLGFIMKCEKVIGAEGQWKYAFYLNLDYD